MTVLSAQTIRNLRVVTPCLDKGMDSKGDSYGLGPCTYDVRIDQDLTLHPGDFVLASTMEYFMLPDFLCMEVKDKSSLVRQRLTVQNTHADPGWRGYLTLELTLHLKAPGPFVFRRGDAVAQVRFDMLDQPTELSYCGKYQDQENKPVPARARFEDGAHLTVE